MGHIVVCGGSVVGLSVAMMSADDGHDVTVLEADPDGAPETPALAWASWRRRGVAQFHQPHSLFTRFRHVCDQELPGLTDRLSTAGCVWQDYLDPLPPTLSDTAARPADAALRFVTGRRPVVESVFAAVARTRRRVSVRRGVRVTGLVPGRRSIAEVPHAAGVRTAGGEVIHADLVVDAMGRRSPAPSWLAGLGARPPVVEAEDRGYVYYTRYFTGPTPPMRRGRALMPMGSFSVLTLAGDNGTWSVTLFGLSGDTPLKAVRDPEVFTRVVEACPAHAHWLDGTPVTDVLAMAGGMDGHRRFVVDGRPVVTGFAAVGDAWACTNPSAGRGLSIGLLHAQVLRGTVRDHVGDPPAFAGEWDVRTERVVGPYYRNQVAADRMRIVEMDAARRGVAAPPPDPSAARFGAAAAVDPEVFRALIETVVCTALPQEVLARPEIGERIERAVRAGLPRPGPSGPDRRELLRLLEARSVA